jgi:hypothetical protein
VDECKPLILGVAVVGYIVEWPVEYQHLLAERRGRAVQVDPIKPKLKPPGTKRFETEI